MEQHSWWRPERGAAPGYVEQARQLTEARAQFAWLRAGSVTVQQQALRDFAQAMRNFFGGTHRRPTWRKASRHEGFRQVAVKPEHIQRLNRRWGRVWVSKVGWVRFRWTRAVPNAVKSYRITRDRADRWHVAFAVVPTPIPAPGNNKVVGVDRGVVVSAALSTGELLSVPGLTPGEKQRLGRVRRALARRKRGSNRRGRAKRAIRGMTLSAKGTVDNPGRGVRQKAGLNRGILANGWGMLVARLEHKAPGRVEKVKAAYTSQQCSACGHIAPENRKSQAVFQCVACGFACHADVNAAKNIAAGRAVTARGALQPLGRAANREPQLAALAL
ncbi:putative transposase [Kibdelosporangium banguiense]|uniref:Transposase n=1 Tax=Kibdelosporangium banguiense TaxID=1365924 RepID=A0ABS4TZW8_9PSEU|nr:putative transposase [Kibdelosporangium banguiense]